MYERRPGNSEAVLGQLVELREIYPNTGAPTPTVRQKTRETQHIVVSLDAPLSVQRLPLHRIRGDETAGGQSEPDGG